MNRGRQRGLEEKCSGGEREVSCVLASARQKSSKPFRRFTIPRTKYISKAAERRKAKRGGGEDEDEEREGGGERGLRGRSADTKPSSY